MTVGLADVSTRLQFSGEQEAEKYIRDMVSVTMAALVISTDTH